MPDSASLGKGIAAFAVAVALTVGSGVAAGGLGGHALVIPRPDRLEPYRFFGDRTVKVPLLIYAPEPERLTLRAELVQLTSNLSVPIGAELSVLLPKSASPRPGIELDLSVPLPAVKRETDFELRIRSRRDRDGVWHAAGRIALRVYPGDLLSPVRDWAKSHSLRVEDDQGSLIQFLRDQEIPFAGVGRTQGLRATRDVTLYAGARALRKRERFPLREGEAIVLFREQKTETSHLLIERTGRGTVVTVEMRLLDRLATDPLAQKVFLEVFQLLHEERPLTKGEFR
jgi:hypothetical protein